MLFMSLNKIHPPFFVSMIVTMIDSYNCMLNIGI